jgi:putative membrane protein
MHHAGMLITRGSSLALLLVAAALVGCRGADEDMADSLAMGDTSAMVPPATATTTPTLTDAQIAHVAVTANSIDSAAGEAARSRARNGGVREFADMMIRDHGSTNRQAGELASRLTLVPEDNDVSRQLQREADDARTSLTNLTGTEFDRAYIDREVQYHQAVLDALDQRLIPGAQNAELKTFLQQVRPNVAAHLQRARTLRGTIGTTG